MTAADPTPDQTQPGRGSGSALSETVGKLVRLGAATQRMEKDLRDMRETMVAVFSEEVWQAYYIAVQSIYAAAHVPLPSGEPNLVEVQADKIITETMELLLQGDEG